MKQNEYNKIMFRRCKWRLRSLTSLLAAFFDISHIHHDEIYKTLSVPCSEVIRLSKDEMNALCRLEHTFGFVSQFDNGFMFYQYNYL